MQGVVLELTAMPFVAFVHFPWCLVTCSNRHACLFFVCRLLEDPMYLDYLKAFSRKYYMPFLLHRVTKVLVVPGFIAMLFVGIAFTSDRLELGLDQKVALPRDSLLQEYFTAIEEDLRTGPPVYFVVNGACGVCAILCLLTSTPQWARWGLWNFIFFRKGWGWGCANEFDNELH